MIREIITEHIQALDEEIDLKAVLRYILLTATLSGIIGVGGNTFLQPYNQQSVYPGESQTLEPVPTELPAITETRITAQEKFAKEKDLMDRGLLSPYHL